MTRFIHFSMELCLEKSSQPRKLSVYRFKKDNKIPVIGSVMTCNGYHTCTMYVIF